MAKFSTPRGTKDYLPKDMAARNYVQKKTKEIFESFGFQQIQTPMFEEFALLSARSGDEIRESMFTFTSDTVEYALRPELTAPICRLIASGKLSDTPKPVKLYYIAECFRYGRPQKGRYREFTQVGVELIGSASFCADAEVIAAAVNILNILNIQTFKLKIGNIGIFRELLQEDGLDFEMQSRIISYIDLIMSVREKCETILSCGNLTTDDIEYVKSELSDLYNKQESIEYSGEFEIYPPRKYTDEIVREWLVKLPEYAENTYKEIWERERIISPEISELLIAVSKIYGSIEEVISQGEQVLEKYSKAYQQFKNLEEVCNNLLSYGITDFQVVLGVARGLDFYTGTVFEIDSPLLGAQKQICGGGRYDNLVEEFGGAKTSATGFAFGFDRLVEVFEASGNKVEIPPFDVFVSITNRGNKQLLSKAIETAGILRKKGVRAVSPLLDYRDLREQLGYADKVSCPYVVIIGEEELRSESCKLKNMQDQTEKLVAISALLEEIVL